VINSNKKITIKSIAAAVSRSFKLYSEYYWEVTNRQTAYRKKVLKALSEKPDEIFSAKTSEKFGLKAVSSTQRALEVLIEQGVVDKTDKKYFFTDPMYSEFIILNL
jgi:hypothetical protein